MSSPTPRPGRTPRPTGADTAFLRELLFTLSKPSGAVAIVEDTPDPEWEALPEPVRGALLDARDIHARITVALQARSKCGAVR